MLQLNSFFFTLFLFKPSNNTLPSGTIHYTVLLKNQPLNIKVYYSPTNAQVIIFKTILNFTLR